MSDTPAAHNRMSGILSHPLLRMLIPLAIMLIALFVLRNLSREIVPADLMRAVQGYSWQAIGMSVAAMVSSYIALALYDPVILRGMKTPAMPGWVPVLTGVSSMAVSNLLGFSWLTGGAIRYRIYAAFGVDIAAVARLIATSWIAFALGLLTLIGLMFTFRPEGLSQVINLPALPGTIIGLSLLAGVGALFLWTWPSSRELRIGVLSTSLPKATRGLTLMAIALTDLIATALTLYFLMPADLAGNFVYFFIIFIGALGLGFISNAPGGLGVFEATIIAALGGTGRPDLLAALLVYRLIYTLMPFGIAVLGLALAWTLANRRRAGAAALALRRAMRPIVPVLTAVLAMLSGAALLLSGDLPTVSKRMDILQDILPLALIETSHLLSSVAGVMLLIVARGLYRRMRRAWLIAMGLLAAGLVASLLRGIEYEAMIALSLSLLVLWSFRDAFHRVGLGSALRLNVRWIVSLVLLFAGITWIGFFAYRNVAYSQELWWQFAWSADAPRFLRATVLVSVLLAAVSLNSLISRAATRLRPEPIPDVVRKLVAQSTVTDAAMALTGDKRFLISPDGDAAIAYADTGRSLIAKGDPIGNRVSGESLIWDLRDMADRMGRTCAFYAVQTAYLPAYLDLGLHVVKIGEIARVPLAGFSLDGPKRKDWRHAQSRAIRDGYDFAIIPAAEVPEYIDALRTVSDAWLALKGGSEKNFALGRFDPAFLQYFDIAVLRHRETGRIASFANILKASDKSELGIDLMRYDPATTPAAMDGLFAGLLLWARDSGYTWFSLGGAPLAGLESRPHAPVWNRVGGFIYTHGARFYHFEGLRSFKQKFDPEWEPNYLASPGQLQAARVLYEVSLLISGGLRGLRRK
ncbi:bifunctional lysylphosphatidylglycerol flippase/synthetase MprF [Loktanella sp. SALINAS62]|uniref:bifunctional lysylphosphatidylglycerol flippase/synthetase MprF n=1 Tax=Loktanella sp. SALINAS62 TaxID=2706124 RepID=UPI001B8CF834|nr:bifunctional lysylphosphatidylglycerol flippase/synthetase MprF [Loktanella sp. SALINAS62]MBS1303973.1 bifunctional lysylphosphatidylglycerol flippase/synthetase MprF [Loktanella sp. SALINAS62]